MQAKGGMPLLSLPPLLSNGAAVCRVLEALVRVGPATKSSALASASASSSAPPALSLLEGSRWQALVNTRARHRWEAMALLLRLLFRMTLASNAAAATSTATATATAAAASANQSARDSGSAGADASDHADDIDAGTGDGLVVGECGLPASLASSLLQCCVDTLEYVDASYAAPVFRCLAALLPAAAVRRCAVVDDADEATAGDINTSCNGSGSDNTSGSGSGNSSSGSGTGQSTGTRTRLVADAAVVRDALDAAWRVLASVDCVGEQGNMALFLGFAAAITQPALFACDELHRSGRGAQLPSEVASTAVSAAAHAARADKGKPKGKGAKGRHDDDDEDYGESEAGAADEGPVHLAVRRLLGFGAARSLRCAHVLAVRLMPALLRAAARPRHESSTQARTADQASIWNTIIIILISSNSVSKFGLSAMHMFKLFFRLYLET
jgi:hypothetical protein